MLELSRELSAHLMAEHGGVVPGEAQLRVRRMTTEHPQRLGALRVDVLSY
ncbi:MAG: hypothetical protein HC853_16690 [Anaerolineae bacterium]|nr:hypothetical protein [Anaerolineae bacterium]